MPNSDQFSSPQDIFSHQESPVLTQRPQGGVWQDKGANFSGRVPSSQPASHKQQQRAQPSMTKTDRYQKLSTTGVRLVPMTLWVHPLIKTEIQRTAQLESIATGEDISASKIGSGYLEYAVRQDIHKQQDALLKPLLKQIIREEFRAFGNRIVFFLMRIAFASEQTRILVTKILHMTLKREGVTEAEFNKVIDRSCDMAKSNIVNKTPQMKSLIAAWEGFGEERENTRSN